jgi:hypothetical protein
MIMNMTLWARLILDSLCFGEAEWKLLYCIANRIKKEPNKPHTMKEAVVYLGRLGGQKRALNN